MTTAAALLLALGLAGADASKVPASLKWHCEAEPARLRVSVDGLELDFGTDIRLAGEPLWVEDKPLSADAVVPLARGELLATKKPEPGIYVGKPEGRALLVAADVLAFCPTGEGDVWALVTRDGQQRFVLVSRNAPTVRFFDWRDVLVSALGGAGATRGPLERLIALFRRLEPASTPLLVAMLVQHREATARVSAAPLLLPPTDAGARAQLWLLAHDREREVRAAVLATVEAHCGAASSATCDDAFAMLVDDPVRDIAWTARDHLLFTRPDVALFGAEAAYKLDAVALLTQGAQRYGREQVMPALDRLLLDDDVLVREAAREVLSEVHP